MNRLTDRLQMIADGIKQGETMADIGTDHGFLPLHLWENGISPKVIMCDISEPSLSKAKAAAGAYQFGHELDFRSGDGIEVLTPGEVDVVVIAGMGGILIRDILAKDMVKTSSFGRYILQPRNNAGALRRWLTASGFAIIQNQLVREGKFICEIITAKPPKSSEIGEICPAEALAEEWEPCWDLPDDIFDGQPELAAAYAGVKLRIEEDILAGMKQGSSTLADDITRMQRRIEYFKRRTEL